MIFWKFIKFQTQKTFLGKKMPRSLSKGGRIQVPVNLIAVKLACFREVFLVEIPWNLDCFCNICYYFTPWEIVLHLKKFSRSNPTFRQNKGKSIYHERKAKRFDYGKPYSNAFTRGQVSSVLVAAGTNDINAAENWLRQVRTSTNNYCPMTEKHSKWILMFFDDCASRQQSPVNQVSSL